MSVPGGYDPHLHLMVDDHEILYRQNLTRLIERPVRVQQEPILQPEHPWEGDGVHLWGSVYREADLYRMWYLGISRGNTKHELNEVESSSHFSNWVFDL